MDDRDEFVQILAELGREPNQPVPLPRRDIDSRWQLAAEDFVFGLQVTDVSRQLTLCGASQNEEQAAVDVSHGVDLRKSLAGKDQFSLLHRGMWAASRFLNAFVDRRKALLDIGTIPVVGIVDGPSPSCRR